MPTTTRGLWYPDGTSSFNIISLLTTAAQSQQSALDSLALTEATPRFATTTARDAAYTNAGVVLVNGMQCTVAGQNQVYYDVNHRNTAGWYAITDTPYTERASTTAQTVPASAWTAAVGFFNINNTNTSDGTTYYTAATDGITVQQAGIYAIDGFIQWAASTGSRFLTVDVSSTAASTAPRFYEPAGGDNSMMVHRELTCAAGAKVSVYVYNSVASNTVGGTMRIRKVS